MSKPSFEVPLRRLRLEMAWLLAEFSTAASGRPNRNNQLACEMTVIRLYDAWARFCRELVILSSLGDVVTAGGQILTRSHPDLVARSVFTPVYLKLSGRSWEPRWADATACIRAAQCLSIQNLISVTSALGAANSPAENMRRIRNFFAHRGHSTSTDAMGTTCFLACNKPSVFHLNDYTTGGVRIFESWTDDLLVVATAAIQ